MKRAFIKYLLLGLIILPIAAFGQGTVYTKTMRLADFPQKTTKIVLSGIPAVDALLKEEITSRWRISPYEFCDEAEYKETVHQNLYYFLHFASDADFTYMLLTKGGPNSGNPLITFMDVVSIPVFSAGEPKHEELVFLPAFIDLVQEYLQKAMVSETHSYGSIKSIKHRIPKGTKVCKDAEEGRRLFIAEAKDTIVPILIWPAETGRRKYYYKLQVSTDNHLLYEFKRKRIHR